MSLALPSILRAAGRTGVRAAFAGALAIGLLTTAPTTQAAEAATARQGAQQTSGDQRAPLGRSARRVAQAIDVAVAQKGDPYRYGAAGPGAFDCSGLTYFSFRKAGFDRIPRTSSAQANFAKRISRANMRRGDLIFFHGSGGVYHMGIYAGFHDGRRLVLHSPSTGGRVRTDPLWTDNWFAGTLRYR